MRNLIIFLAMVITLMAMPSTIIAQSRRQIKTTERLVTSLGQQRVKELEPLNSALRDAIGDEKKGIKTEITEVNERYDKLITAAMSFAPEEPKKNDEEKKIKPKRRIFGSDFYHQGDGNYFRGNSSSVEKGSNAYATVVVADANAQLIKSLSSGGSTVSASSIKEVGLQGVVANKYRYNREIKITITGSNSGNNYRKVFLLSPGQQVQASLLPGKYAYTIEDCGYQNKIGNFSVAQGQNLTHSYNGQEVFWAIWGGKQ